MLQSGMTESPTQASVRELIARARRAQQTISGYTQAQADLLALSAAWALIEPTRNQELAELAVTDTGLGNVHDKIKKNHRKTMGLLRDLRTARTVGVIRDNPDRGITEIARPAGVIASIVPSTNPAATPVNNIVNALKCLNAIIIAPSPRGWATSAQVVKYVHAELDKLNAPRDLVQLLPKPVSKEATHALMAGADLIVATGSQSNIRAAYSSGRPALGVGAGNVSVIIDATANLDRAAQLIAASKTFDNATSCSAENSLVLPAKRYQDAIAALVRAGGVLLDANEKSTLTSMLWNDGKLNPDVMAKSAPEIVQIVGWKRAALQTARFLMVEESGWGPDFPFSGEKLSPIVTLYRADNLSEASRIVEGIYSFQGAGHSVGLHTGDMAQALELGQHLPVSRVIVNQAHALATGGNFDNGLPFSLSMGCGTWGGNSTSENLHWKHYMNITRVVKTIPEVQADEHAIMKPYFDATVDAVKNADQTNL